MALEERRIAGPRGAVTEERPLAGPTPPAQVAVGGRPGAQVAPPPPPMGSPADPGPGLVTPRKLAGTAAPFDPYYHWLGIPPDRQPANAYDLLGIRCFETDEGVIENAANRQMMYLRSLQGGARVAHSQRLLNEVAQAKLLLLDPARKRELDRRLRGESETGTDANESSTGTRPARRGPGPPPPPRPAALSVLRTDPSAGQATYYRRPSPPPSADEVIPMAELVDEEIVDDVEIIG